MVIVMVSSDIPSVDIDLKMTVCPSTIIRNMMAFAAMKTLKKNSQPENCFIDKGKVSLTTAKVNTDSSKSAN